ncbi:MULTISPECIES: energy-coupling factor ABC transporter permease [Methanobacterium]|uniref:Energy-coupling factor ABC transporter permease n=1 Tax=Methanobacterium veterum TaxID=408577 RepID=A0A9E5DLA4_9EURY|nr:MULTISPECIES: ECF transporter S component [Methanobacterium]MCZ3367153.1 energy-coupling factor ABC transporter permease [Methanobacterium veterum]MCZ3373699.1 energy-coupling factor ABC transporter permease [Methanobacterium veterum]
MHLPDGIIPLWQAAIYWILTIIIMAVYIFKLSRTEEKEKKIVATAIFAAATFVASSLSIPSPFGVPMHFFLIPLVVILLGPLSGVAVEFLCLIVQFFFLGMGGITSLGANTMTMGIVLSFSTYLFYKLTLDLDKRLSVFAGTLMGIAMATIAQALMLVSAGVATLDMLMATLIPFYLFVAVIEGIANVLIVSALSGVKPELLTLNKGEEILK